LFKLGREFEIWPYKLKQGKGKFCSQKCYWESIRGKEKKENGGKIKIICSYCGKEFLSWPNGSNRRKYCSLQCYWKDRKGKFVKEKSGHWKGGITLINQVIRNSEKHKEWANKVYRRDNWQCQLCGIKCQKNNIAAHHLKEFSQYPELRFDVDNGITLCKRCHAKIHKLGNLGIQFYGNNF
jgi:hypothetical protein